MIEKLAVGKFIRKNPTIDFNEKEVNEISQKFSKAFKILRTLGKVDIYDLTKNGDLLFKYTDACDQSTVYVKVFCYSEDEEF